MRLGINIDHIATVRNARGGLHPCPVRGAELAREAGADGITAHLREDRRHIRDEDIKRIRAEVALPLNFEMAATAEMQAIALHTKPNACCLVPESRAELTTEGGLNVVAQQDTLRDYIAPLKAAGIRISLFVDADKAQLDASRAVGADIVELHTGRYCDSAGGAQADELRRIQSMAAYGDSLGLEIHAGHGLSYDNVAPIAEIPEMIELNIGHFLMGEAMFVGLEAAIGKMRRLMDDARGGAA